MKKPIYFLLLLLTITACSKNDDPKPSSNVEGTWTLGDVTFKYSVLGEDDQQDYTFDGANLYLTFKEGNKFESNLGVDYASDEIFAPTSKYESTYKQDGDYLTLELYADEYKKNIPVKTKVKKSGGNELVLVMTKEEMLSLLNEMNKLDDYSQDIAILSLFTSLEFTLEFTKK
jgi:hypothetical protein